MTKHNPDSYDIYLKAILALVRTLVIKFDAMAMAINYEVLLKTGILPDENDRATWKWYLNSAGIYHPSDDKMYITSLDDETLITFDAAMLRRHPITLVKYSYGTELYKLLLEKYPKNEKMILGALYPVDINKAIEAEDGDILSYPSFLVEHNEIDLINDLTSWGKRFAAKWRIRGYEITDDLYRASFLGQFTLAMVGYLLQYRLSKCKTSQAHSYHVRQYLKSRGFTDTELSTLTYNQLTYFYRNIDNIRKNTGSWATNSELIEVLFTQLSLPIYQCVSSHRTIGMRDVWFADRPDNLPAIEFDKKPMNSIATDIPVTSYSIDNVFSEISPLAPKNKQAADYNREEVLFRMTHNVSSTHGTKVLECAPSISATKTDSALISIIFDLWVYLSTTNRYTTPLEFTIKGSSEPVVLDHQTTIALWAYGILKQDSMNAKSDWLLPTITLDSVIRDNPPPLSAMMKLARGNEYLRDDLALILNTYPILPQTTVSAKGLIVLARQISVAKERQKRLVSFLNNPKNAVDLTNAIAMLYTRPVVKLNDLLTEGITKYSILFTKLGLDFSTYSKTDFLNMSISIFQSVYGTELKESNSESAVRAVMMSLFSRLSSYSILMAEAGVEYLEMIHAPAPAIRGYVDQSIVIDSHGCSIDPIVGCLDLSTTVGTLNRGKILSGNCLGLGSTTKNDQKAPTMTNVYIDNRTFDDKSSRVGVSAGVVASDRDNYHMLTKAQREKYRQLFER